MDSQIKSLCNQKFFWSFLGHGSDCSQALFHLLPSRLNCNLLPSRYKSSRKPRHSYGFNDTRKTSKDLKLESCSPGTIKSLEKVPANLIRGRKKNLKGKGLVHMTKSLRLTIRKTLTGEGSKTWAHFQMRIHKQLINLQSHS